MKDGLKRRSALKGWALAVTGSVLTSVGAPLAVAMYVVLTAPSTDLPTPGRIGSTAPDATPAILFTIGVLLAIGGIALTLREQYVSQARLEELESRRTRSVTRFTDELGSTLDVLLDYSRSDGMRGASEALVKDVLREGRRLYAHPGVRLCLYMIETAEAEDPKEERNYLVLREFDGRRDSPRSEFSDGDHSACLLRIAKGNRAVAVVDPANPPDAITVDHSEHSGWTSFLAIPLIRGRDNLGVLLVDTRHRTEFTDEDKSIGWTISRLIVHGLQQTERQAMDPRPEVSDALAMLLARRSAGLTPDVGGA